MKYLGFILITLFSIINNSNLHAQSNEKSSLFSADEVNKSDNLPEVSPMAYQQLEEDNIETLKRKRLKIAGYTILTGLVGSGTILGIWGGVKAKKAGEIFGEKYYRDKRYSNYLFTGMMTTTVGLSASIPLLLKSRKKKD